MKTEKQLITAECANYFREMNGITNYCCLGNGCVFFGEEEKPRCKYFETSVLPLDTDLEFRYRKERMLSTFNLIKSCKRCLEPFAGNNKEKYCKGCKVERKREQKKTHCLQRQSITAVTD